MNNLITSIHIARYRYLKKQYTDTLVFMKIDDKGVAIDNDAVKVSNALNIPITDNKVIVDISVIKSTFDDTLIIPIDEMPKGQRGGRRDNAGRKRCGRSIPINLRLSQEAYDIYSKKKCKTTYIDALIRAFPDFVVEGEDDDE